jgi:hypothetical protein
VLELRGYHERINNDNDRGMTCFGMDTPFVRPPLSLEPLPLPVPLIITTRSMAGL